MKSIFLLAAISGLGCCVTAHAAIDASGSLTDSGQIRTATNNPFFTTPGQTDLVGVNFHYSGGNVNFQSTPDVPAGTVNGVAFDNIDMWNGNTSTAPAAGPHALSANGAGPTLTVTSSATYNDVRNQTTTIAGTDGANLQAVADEFYYFGTSDSRSPLTLSFANLGVAEGEALYVQLIGGAIFGNGADINVSANGNSIGAWSVNTTTDEADLFGFDTVAGPGGSLELGLSAGNFPGISGVMISTTNSGPDTTPPTLAAVDPLSPADDAGGVAVETNLEVTFNESVAYGTGFVRIRESSGGAVVEAYDVGSPPANLTLSGDTLIIDPGSDLAVSTGYYVEIEPTAIDDLAGNSFAGMTDATTWNFVTAGPDSTPPTLAAVDPLSPADDAGGVAVETNLEVTFNESVAYGTGFVRIRESSGGAVVEAYDVSSPPANLTLSGDTLTIDPGSDLAVSTGYYVEIEPTAIDDLAGNSFTGITDATTWNFTTEAASSPSIIYSDTFTRSGALHGSAPDTAPGAETWATGGGWTTDGTSTNPGGDRDSQAFLPFTPMAGKVYTVKATIDTTTGHPGWWLGIGFSNTGGLSSPFFSNFAPLIREGQGNVWYNYAALGGSAAGNLASGSAGTGAVEYAIELDTQPALWTAKFFVNGVEVDSHAYSTNPTINWVGIGNWYAEEDAADDTVDSFELKEGAYNQTVPPTLLPQNIVDDRSGGPVHPNTLLTYTVTFSHNIDAATVSAADFGNAGSAPISFGSIAESSPGVFAVEVAPTGLGSLQLQVPAGATIMDPSGNALDTSTAIVDDTNIDVVVDTIPPAPDPMTFSYAPQPSSATSIEMTATTATDLSGVEYFFDETSGNPGGDDSGWQASPIYEDTGLTTGLQYTYTVTVRDLSAQQNTTAPSDPASAIAQTPVVPPAITAPTSRHIVQRSAANVGAIQIEGTYSIGSPDSVEARAVVMTGSGNSGTTTAWQVIDAAPAGGNFSGILINVPAGGWYQLEVRSVTSGTPSGSAVLEKVGVGDIFVTAGQSNSSNWSPGGYVPSDDRVSARDTVSGSTWVLATDPIPIADGTGGTVWTRLGDQLATTLDIPIGFIAVGVGATRVGQWVPGSDHYNNRLKPAVQSLPVNGFRAVLWHQGESDTAAGTSAADYASRLTSIISQSRIDAGWDIPWYIAEASWYGRGAQIEERVVAGQRLAVHGDPLTFLGETTDDMNLTGSPLHFDIPHQLERVQQYTEILAGTPAVTPANGNFEDNRTPALTGLSPLADGTSDLLVITDGNTRRPIGWRILAAGGIEAADGTNGYHNPSTGTFAGAVDTINDGVLPNMDGKHVALLDGGTADNYFLHSTRALAEANTTYTLTAAIGVRDNPATYGTARLEITANGAVVASASFDKAALDALRGSDASGAFTDASLSWTTGGTVGPNQPLAVRIVKEGGAGTVLDFDNVRLSAAVVSNNFNSWISDPAFGLDPSEQGFGLDPDRDGLVNGVEAWFGTHPGQFNVGVSILSSNGTTTTFEHPQNESSPSDVVGFYEWSPNLNDWFASGSGPAGGPTVSFVPNTVGTTTTVTASASEPLGQLFLRVGVMQN